MKITKITPIGIKNNKECDLSDPEATPAFMVMVSAYPLPDANKRPGVFIVAHNRVYNFIVEMLGREYTIDQYLSEVDHTLIGDYIKDDGELIVMLGDGPIDGPFCKEILKNVKDFCDML